MILILNQWPSPRGAGPAKRSCFLLTLNRKTSEATVLQAFVNFKTGSQKTDVNWIATVEFI